MQCLLKRWNNPFARMHLKAMLVKAKCKRTVCAHVTTSSPFPVVSVGSSEEPPWTENPEQRLTRSWPGALTST